MSGSTRVERQCFSLIGSDGPCERCKHDKQSCKKVKTSKKGKEIKVKKEPGVDEGGVSDVRTGSKQKAVAKGKDQGPKPKVRKSRASSSASAMSLSDLVFTSRSISSVPASSAITDGGSDMEVVNEDLSPDNANAIKQISPHCSILIWPNSCWLFS